MSEVRRRLSGQKYRVIDTVACGCGCGRLIERTTQNAKQVAFDRKHAAAMQRKRRAAVQASRVCVICGASFLVPTNHQGKQTCGGQCGKTLSARVLKEACEKRMRRRRERFVQTVEETLGRGHKLTRDQLVEMLMEADERGYWRACAERHKAKRRQERAAASASTSAGSEATA
jgi:hypothetical protein